MSNRMEATYNDFKKVFVILSSIISASNSLIVCRHTEEEYNLYNRVLQVLDVADALQRKTFIKLAHSIYTHVFIGYSVATLQQPFVIGFCCVATESPIQSPILLLTE
jgi:hypothetical protein